MSQHAEADRPDQNVDTKGTATSAPPAPAPARPRVDRMPPWKVLLHNDDVNDMLFVVDTIVTLGMMNRQMAVLRMLEAHETGVALLATTHRERAELYQEQLASKGLMATIERA